MLAVFHLRGGGIFALKIFYDYGLKWSTYCYMCNETGTSVIMISTSSESFL